MVSNRVFGWRAGRVESERTVPVAVWLKDVRVELTLEWNIPLRCGLDSSVKIWRTEPLPWADTPGIPGIPRNTQLFYALSI